MISFGSAKGFDVRVAIHFISIILFSVVENPQPAACVGGVVQHVLASHLLHRLHLVPGHRPWVLHRDFCLRCDGFRRSRSSDCSGIQLA